MPLPEKIPAMAALVKGGPVVPYEYQPKPLGQNDVDIHVLYNGICATDIHMIDNDWHMSTYPLIPGHEVCGEVVGLGPAVQGLKVGDHVALGCLAQACLKCNMCEGRKRDNSCPERVFTYMGSTKDETGVHQHYGGFSSYIRTDGRFVFKVPAGYSLEHVGPLMCAGATVVAPLYNYCGQSFNGAGKTFGIVGLGGLGHLAVMFSRQMGAQTTVFSRGPAKRQFALDLGATTFVDSEDKAQMAAVSETIDLLMVCTSGGSFDADKYFDSIKHYGVMHFVGVPNESLKFSVMPLIFKHLSVAGSGIASSATLQQMLDFAAAKNIKPIIEVFPHSKANEAIQKVKDNTIRFRAVLKNDLA